MAEIANVKIWNNVVGAVSWNASTGLASFEFENSFFNGQSNFCGENYPTIFVLLNKPDVRPSSD